MAELRLVVYAAIYIGLGYIVFAVLAWLVTRNEPDLKSVFDAVMMPILWPLRLVMAPFGVEVKLPQNSQRELRKDRPSSPTTLGGTVGQFQSQKQAKEYLIRRILAAAQRERVPLDEIERKMLYFSETDWTPPDLPELDAAFKRDYDEDGYEEKIAGLVRSLQATFTREEQEAWDDAAIKVAADGDHYLTVLISQTVSAPPPVRRGLALWLPEFDRRAERPQGDLRRLILVALLIFLVIFVFTILKAASH